MKLKPTLRFVDLGAASKRTLGSVGDYTDFVRMRDHWGISRD